MRHVVHILTTLLISGCSNEKETLALSQTSVRTKFWPIPKTFAGNEDVLCTVSRGFRFTEAQPVLLSPHLSRLSEATQFINYQIEHLLGRYAPFAGATSPCRIDMCEMNVETAEAGMSEASASESYSITFNAGESSCQIGCPTAYGCIRGLFTFLQMIDPVNGFTVPSTFEIYDEPAFSHRGLLIDTSRHYIPVSMIEDHIRVMAGVKMNVLHWHIVDDHSFPLELEGESVKLLSEKGAYNPRVIYKKSDIERVVKLASSFGIRVIPEIDIPGHTTSWRQAYPELLGIAKSALDPTREENYIFIENVLREVIDVFRQDIYEGPMQIHLGGDETWDGWDTPEIRSWMDKNGMGNPIELIQYWVSRIMGIAKKLNIKITLWEDFLQSTNDRITGFDDGDNPITWQTWLRGFPETIDLGDYIDRKMIFSKSFYLDKPDLRWTDMYRIDLRGASSARLLGAEACMWGEWVDESNMFPRTWPRAAAIADRFWCGAGCSTDPSENAILRLAKWRCRMVELFGFKTIEPVGNETPRLKEREWIYGTDRSQWWCDEADLNLRLDQGSIYREHL